VRSGMTLSRAAGPYDTSYGNGTRRTKASKNGRRPGKVSTRQVGKDAGEQSGPLLSIGIPLPLLSSIVFHALYRPIGILLRSTGI
jgi:hypothetical protein